MLYGILAGGFVICASIFGSILGLIFKNISHRTNDIILGFAAGVMLTAAFVGLLPTAFWGMGAIEGFSSLKILHLLIGMGGVFMGAAFICLIDRFVPHIHFDNGNLKESQSKSGGNRTMLLVIAIAIHNIPEGLATGIVFSEGLTKNAIVVALSMVIQKIPEGLIVAVPLLAMGLKKSKAFGISVVVAIMMLPGVLVGVILGSLPQILTTLFYGFTFGAILYVVSDEIIPESHEHGYQRAATFALIAGVLVVAIMEYL